MNGITINIDPVIFRFGFIELRYYSLAIIVAVFTAVLIAARRAPGKGIDSGHIYSLALWVVAGGIVGARLLHVIDRWDFYAVYPAQIFSMQQGGLAIWGALVGGGIALCGYAIIKKLPLGRLFDAVVPGLLIAQMIGRLGCIINGDAYGGPTDLPWGFIYIHPNAMIPPHLAGIPTHPYPVYEMLWNAATLALVWRLERVFKKDGLLFLTYMVSYSLSRFVLTYVRQEKVWFWGLQEAQVVSLLTVVAAAALMIYLSRRRAPGERAAA